MRTMALNEPGPSVAFQIARSSSSVSTRSRLATGASGRFWNGFVDSEPRLTAHW